MILRFFIIDLLLLFLVGRHKYNCSSFSRLTSYYVSIQNVYLGQGGTIRRLEKKETFAYLFILYYYIIIITVVCVGKVIIMMMEDDDDDG